MTKTLRTRVLPAVLLLGGLALVVWLVVQAGPAAVVDALRHAGIWLPVVVCLEIVMATCDALAVRGLLGQPGARVVSRTWIRATGLAYGASVLLPAGRLTGEAVRAATLATQLGMPRATHACSRLQASALAANAVISLLGVAVLALGAQPPPLLLTFLALNGVGCGLLATAVFYLANHAGVGAWLRQRLAQFLPPLTDDDPSAPPLPSPLVGVALCTAARLVQTAQYGLIVLAVGGAFGVTTAFVAQGIHLVGAAVGDAIPGQLGATEGAYRAFAGVLGFAALPARAVAIALVMRVAQLIVASLGLLVGFVARPPFPQQETP